MKLSIAISFLRLEREECSFEDSLELLSFGIGTCFLSCTPSSFPCFDFYTCSLSKLSIFFFLTIFLSFFKLDSWLLFRSFCFSLSFLGFILVSDDDARFRGFGCFRCKSRRFNLSSPFRKVSILISSNFSFPLSTKNDAFVSSFIVTLKLILPLFGLSSLHSIAFIIKTNTANTTLCIKDLIFELNNFLRFPASLFIHSQQ